MRRQGFLKVSVDGEIRDLEFGMQLDRFKVHDIELLVDTVKVGSGDKSRQRLSRTLQEAMKTGKGSVMVMRQDEKEPRHYSKLLMCPSSGISYEEPEPNTVFFQLPLRRMSQMQWTGYYHRGEPEKDHPRPG